MGHGYELGGHGLFNRLGDRCDRSGCEVWLALLALGPSHWATGLHFGKLEVDF